LAGARRGDLGARAETGARRRGGGSCDGELAHLRDTVDARAAANSGDDGSSWVEHSSPAIKRKLLVKRELSRILGVNF